MYTTHNTKWSSESVMMSHGKEVHGSRFRGFKGAKEKM